MNAQLKEKRKPKKKTRKKTKQKIEFTIKYFSDILDAKINYRKLNKYTMKKYSYTINGLSKWMVDNNISIEDLEKNKNKEQFALNYLNSKISDYASRCENGVLGAKYAVYINSYIEGINLIFNTSIKYKDTNMWMEYQDICEKCNIEAELVEDIYNGYIYSCPFCSSRVSVHKGTNIPMGTLANSEVGQQRKQVHRSLETIFGKNKRGKEMSHIWLSKILNIKDAHVGNFDLETCEKVLKILAQYD